MDGFSYISVLISIVLALGITRLLVGIGKFMEKRGEVRIYWVHLMWAVNTFLFLTLQWWILFRWDIQQEWTFFLNLFLLASPTIVFLMCVILFPEPINDGADFKKHYFSNHRWFFALAATLPMLDFIDTYLKGYPTSARTGHNLSHNNTPSNRPKHNRHSNTQRKIPQILQHILLHLPHSLH